SLDLPLEKVRVIYTPAGGAFGGKEEPTVQIHCALGAILTGRPVKMVLTRQESLIMSTKRHRTKMYYRHGAAADGKITAMEARVIVDAGAYESLSKPVVFRTGIITAGPYDIPNVSTDSYGVYTNNPPGGAFRGFGTTQVAFGAEMQIDKLALALKMDPFELRKINGLAPGKATITGQVIKGDCGFQQALAKVEQSLNEYLKVLPGPPAGKKIGIGVAGAYKNVGLGAGKTDQAGARIEIDRSGTLQLLVGAADMGQGSDTTMAQLAAQESGLPYEDFVVTSNDTGQTPEGGVTTASRQTYISGHAVLGAAREFNTVFQRCLAELFGLAKGEYKVVHGGIETRDQKGNTKLINYRDLALAAEKAGLTLVGEYIYTAPLTYPLRERSDHEEGVPLENFDVHFAYCYAAQAAVVEVDETSGEVKVLKIIAAQDLGKAIHPQNSRCQIEGAILMGMGYGLSEEFVLENGLMVTDNLAKLKLLKITAMPQMEIILVEEESGGPYGAKGMGELPLNPTAPAIINAINNAVGVRINDLPATSDKVKAALNEKRGTSKC
ncbi:MAG: molybdopterin cofactor-binding domain-containing protein, partial [Dethiobacteria bacterium]|nr:molybdopterin cofactor-binding domain-containing protein [Dethiobacteria bacterium]